MPQQSPGVAVAYVASRYPKGSETFVFREVGELERQGHNVLVIAFASGDGARVHADAARAGRLVVVPTASQLLSAQLYWLRRRPGAYLRVWLECLAGTVRSPHMLVRTIPAVPLGAYVGRVVAERAIPHIHAHWATHPTTAALVAGALSKTPFSFTGHGYDVQVGTAMLARKLSRAAFAATICEYNRDVLAALDGDARIEVVRCGIDFDAFAPVRAPARNGTFRVTCVARLSPEKGQEHLLGALARLQAGGREVACTLVGDGKDRARLERLRDSLELTNVLFAGQTDSEGVRHALSGSHALVLPSLREGIPIALMEAMAMGVPVIASRVGGVPELVQDGVTGLLVSPGDEADLARGIERLMDDPELADRLAANGNGWVRDRHAVSESAARLASLYAAVRPA